MDASKIVFITILTLILTLIPWYTADSSPIKIIRAKVIALLLSAAIVILTIYEYSEANTKIDNLTKKVNATKINTDSITLVSDEIQKSLEGGTSFIKFDVPFYDENTKSFFLEMMVFGEISMKNVEISINVYGHKPNDAKNDYFQITPTLKKNVVRHYPNNKVLQFDFLRPTTMPVNFATISTDNFGRDAQFFIIVDSENGKRLQNLSCTNFRETNFMREVKSNIHTEKGLLLDNMRLFNYK